MKVIYKITYPNGKIYIGQDLTGDHFAGVGFDCAPSVVKVARPETTAVEPVLFGLGVKLNSHEPASEGSVLWPTEEPTKTKIRINTLRGKKLFGDIRSSIARIQPRTSIQSEFVLT